MFALSIPLVFCFWCIQYNHRTLGVKRLKEGLCTVPRMTNCPWQTHKGVLFFFLQIILDTMQLLTMISTFQTIHIFLFWLYSNVDELINNTIDDIDWHLLLPKSLVNYEWESKQFINIFTFGLSLSIVICSEFNLPTLHRYKLKDWN